MVGGSGELEVRLVIYGGEYVDALQEALDRLDELSAEKPWEVESLGEIRSLVEFGTKGLCLVDFGDDSG